MIAMGTLPPKPTNRTSARFQRAHWLDVIKPPHPAYWIVVDGEHVGYVTADRAGREAGTNSHWRAYDSDGRAITADRPTLRDVKTEVAAWLAK